MVAPSGEKVGSALSPALLVSRSGWPPAICRTQMSSLPSPPASEAYASSLPSGEIAGSAVNPPESGVNRLRTTGPVTFGVDLIHSQIAKTTAIAQKAEMAAVTDRIRRRGGAGRPFAGLPDS